MANIGAMGAIDPAANSIRMNEAAQGVRPARTEQTQPGVRPQTEAARPEDQAQETGKQELPNVISVSRDGDTVQASDEAVQELEEENTIGRVIGDPENARVQQENGSESREELVELELERSAEIRREQLEAAQEESRKRREAALEAAREAAREEEQTPLTNEEANEVLAGEEEAIAEEGQISSFVGYSDAELERMYLQGDISRYDYDQEMENRAAEREERNEEMADFALENTGNALRAVQNEEQGAAIEEAFSDNANERLDVQNRAQIIQAMIRMEQPEETDPNQIAPLMNFALS